MYDGSGCFSSLNCNMSKKLIPEYDTGRTSVGGKSRSSFFIGRPSDDPQVVPLDIPQSPQVVVAEVRPEDHEGPSECCCDCWYRCLMFICCCCNACLLGNDDDVVHDEEETLE